MTSRVGGTTVGADFGFQGRRSAANDRQECRSLLFPRGLVWQAGEIH